MNDIPPTEEPTEGTPVSPDVPPTPLPTSTALPPPTTAAPQHQPVWQQQQPQQPQAAPQQAPYQQPAPQPPQAEYRPPPGAPPPISSGPPRPAPQPRRGGGMMTCAVIVVIVMVLFFGFMALMSFALKSSATTASTTWAGSTSETVGVIKVTGVISTISTVSPFFGSTSGSESICEQIRQAEKDRDTKALVLRINSPGGSAAGSQEIYAAIEEYKRKTGNPVIASMGDVAASGGYYVAAPCDRIMALPATMTGSIGVIFETIEYHQLMKNLGVEPHTITSGPFKDSGSPFRAMTPEDEEVFRAMIDDVFDQFVTAVVDGRGMEEEVVRKLADGRVYTGRQAVENGLIDETGTFYDAIMLAATEAGIQGEPAVRFYGRVSLLGGLLTTDMESVAPPQTLPPGLLLDTRLWSASQMIAGQASAAVEAR